MIAEEENADTRKSVDRFRAEDGTTELSRRMMILGGVAAAAFMGLPPIALAIEPQPASSAGSHAKEVKEKKG
jgi:hypothetical protein